MTYDTYVANISFRFIQPHMNTPRGIHKLGKILETVSQQMKPEVLNTKLPENDSEMKVRLQEICKVPRMSTFAIGAILNEAVSRMPVEQAYVNVGVLEGFTFLAGMAGNPDKKCVGIDNFSEFGGPRESFMERFNAYKSANHFFYDMDYKDYFSKIHKGPIGVYMYDGHHSYENQLQGLQIAEPFLAKDCIIVVDDVNWDGPRQATLDFVKNSRHQYVTLLDKRTRSKGHLTFHNGIMVLRKTS